MAEESQSLLDRITPEDQIYFTRIIFSFIAAAICLGLNLLGIFAAIGFVLGAIMIGLSYLIPIYLFGLDPQDVGGHAKGIMKGLGTGILLFLVIWFLVFNFIYAGFFFVP